MATDRDQLLRAAATLLSRRPTATMGEVAAAAGIGRATLHRHFAGRDVLVRALEDLGLRELEAALDRAAPAEGTATEAVRRLVAEIQGSADLLAFLYSEAQLFERETLNDGWTRLEQRVEALFRRGQEQGEFRIDLTPAWLCSGLLGLVVSCSWSILDGRVAEKDFAHMVGELVLGGARRTPEP